VVPLLSEVDRFTTALRNLNFKNPQPIEGRKLHHLKTLISEGQNVVTTHALFRMLEGSDEAHIKRTLRDLITIYGGSMNDIGKEGVKEHPLSGGWYKRTPAHVLARRKAATENFFRKVAQTPSHLNGWTTWRDYRKALKGNSYSRNSSTPDKSFGFIPTNAKATNDYRRVASVAYLVNVFDTPADSAKLKALSERFNGDFATIGDCEAATALLAKYNYKAQCRSSSWTSPTGSARCSLLTPSWPKR
jgi:hypothetical protein